MITVAVVEDDDETRIALVAVLSRATDIDVVGDYATGEDAIQELPSKRPSVVLMDVNLPGIDGVQCVRQLVALIPVTQIIMLTVFDNTDVIFQSLSAGASGYLLKPVRPAQLIAAVRDVKSGGAPITSNIARKLVQAFQQRSPDNPIPTSAEGESNEFELSPREREVLDLLAQGYLYKEIAKQFSVSYSTVHTHIERIYQKLRVRSRSQAVAKFYSKRTMPPS